MSKRISLLATALLIISSAVFVAAQTTTTTVTQTPTKVTKTVQNPDGTYTVIEYPVGKEVQLTFTPVSLTKSKAVGTILRDDTGTKVILNLTDVPAEVSAINVYAVDDAGVVTSLGPVILANGAGKFTATTPLSKFMLIAAPEGTLTAYDPNTKVFFRSAVPEGFAVIPLSTSPVGETVAATAAPVAVTATPVVVTATPVAETAAPVVVTATPVAVTAAPVVVTAAPVVVTAAPVAVTAAPVVVTAAPVAVTAAPVVVTAAPVVVTAAPVAVTAAPVVVTAAPVADAATVVPVPMLNIPAYKKGDDTKLKVDFTGAMSGARANIFIEPNKNGKETEVKMVFHDLKEAPTGQIYILWAVSPDNQFSKLGQIVNLKGRNEAEIKANTTLADFGLLVTMEDLAAAKTVVIPVGPRLGVIQLIP
jgi:hypothetical protein